MKKKHLESLITNRGLSGDSFSDEMYAMRKEQFKKSNPPDNSNCWCDNCKEWSMELKGSIYNCEACENWRYSSS